jgi:hypothetical protein
LPSPAKERARDISKGAPIKHKPAAASACEVIFELRLYLVKPAREGDRISANRIAEIINNRRRITADTALRLGFYFGDSPGF